MEARLVAGDVLCYLEGWRTVFRESAMFGADKVVVKELFVV